MTLKDTSDYKIKLLQKEDLINAKGKEFSNDGKKGKERYRSAEKGNLTLFVCVHKDDNISVNESFAKESLDDDIVKSRYSRFESMNEV